MIPLSIVATAETFLEKRTAVTGRIEETKMLGGGSINDCCMLKYQGKKFFMKWNSSERFPGMFKAEATGLALLSETDCIKTPEIIGLSEDNSYSFLLLEFFEAGIYSPDFWRNFGKQLACLHQTTSPLFGLNHNNYIGSINQQNDFRLNWTDFFIEMRLEPMIRLATQKGLIENSTRIAFDRLFNKLEGLFPKEVPSLLHGDLWSGNFLCDTNRQAVIFDPAVYFGNREMDIAMTKLFGGFDALFYEAYNQSFPLEKGWLQRTDLCNLFPLMVHVNLFGGSYHSQVKTILKYFVG
ncbi:MAG: ketosamine-3-kinase [Bacteroidetes bacterium HGW-Bacteroidetes-1]|jgi:hypothetical protein|nr:MAG: ketosamine-3-kinase [Bacteroidetes bacterium HGW-Bacteroidetes-1]